MKLDNRKNVYNIWLKKFLATILLTIMFITFGFTDFFQAPVLGIEKTWYLLALAIVYFCLGIYHYLQKPNYVSYNDNGDKIILRYYPVHILNRRKNSIEVPKENFESWETKKFLFGTGEMLFVNGRYKTKLAKYPGISLSAVNLSDRDKIKKALDTFVKQN